MWDRSKPSVSVSHHDETPQSRKAAHHPAHWHRRPDPLSTSSGRNILKRAIKVRYRDRARARKSRARPNCRDRRVGSQNHPLLADVVCLSACMGECCGTDCMAHNTHNIEKNRITKGSKARARSSARGGWFLSASGCHGPSNSECDSPSSTFKPGTETIHC